MEEAALLWAKRACTGSRVGATPARTEARREIGDGCGEAASAVERCSVVRDRAGDVRRGPRNGIGSTVVGIKALTPKLVEHTKMLPGAILHLF